MLLYSLFASILSPHFLNTLDLTIFMPYLLGLYFFFIFIWSLGGKKKIIHSNTQTITIHEGCSSVFQSLPRCHPLLSLFHLGDFSYTRGVHHKQIMSNCKCLCFLKGPMRGWIECPSPHQVALPRLPAAPLSSGLSLAVAALSEIKMGSPLLYSVPLRSTHVCEWTGCVFAHMPVTVSTYVCINTHSSFLPSTVL